MESRSRWPRGLRRRSTAARLLRSWVRIPSGHGRLSVVSVVCCQVEVSATDWSLVQRSPTDCGASLCVIKKPRKRGGYSPAIGLQNTNLPWVVAPVEKKSTYSSFFSILSAYICMYKQKNNFLHIPCICLLRIGFISNCRAKHRTAVGNKTGVWRKTTLFAGSDVLLLQTEHNVRLAHQAENAPGTQCWSACVLCDFFSPCATTPLWRLYFTVL